MFPLAVASTASTCTPTALSDVHKPGYARANSFLLIVADIKIVGASTDEGPGRSS